MGHDSTSVKSGISRSTNPSTERTPLLSNKTSETSPAWHNQSVAYRVLFSAFIITLSFSVTQVPLVYVFGVMTCESYYETHPIPPGPDRCRNHEIESSTARAIALLGAGTTLFGVFNLFFTGWTIKVLGVKKALLLTVFFPAVRLLVQNVGVEIGSGMGIIIMQASQLITVVGGPAGYVLALSTFATEVVEPAERTATLGRLSGCSMFGTALGFFAGGYLGDAFSIAAPFRVTLVLFIVSFLYILAFLPTIKNSAVEQEAAKSMSAFFDPLKLFVPKKWLLRDGKIQTERGVLLLGVGTFMGCLSYSYVPVLLQMYSTDIFSFGTTENGVLIGLNSLIRGLFLTFMFPIIISRGRKWLSSHDSTKPANTTADPDLTTDHEPPYASEIAGSVPNALDDDAEPPLRPSQPSSENESYAFDLWFTKYSLIADGLLTGLATFTTRGWQMYLIAVVLPLASGTGPSAKGTILQMCPPDQRADALSAISLVELIARLVSTGVFGLVFSAFADLGQPNLTFTVNAAIAVVGFVVLIFTRFPPEGATRYVKEEVIDDDDVVQDVTAS
nr:putative membrane protein c14c4.07 [Quercus suber]